MALRQALSHGLAAEVTAWRDDMSGRELMPRRPQAGSVTSKREIPEIGVTVLSLSNGAEVWLKPTDFKNDQVLITSYAKGGTSLASPSEYYEAALSPSLVGIGGVGGFTPIELEKLLPGKLVDASAYMSLYTHGLSGSSTPRDLETALQLLHLHFTAPNRTPDTFELLKRRLSAALANQSQSPGAVFSERLRRVNTMDHYTSRSMTVDDVEKLQAGVMQNYYDARFANAADFTFFVTGTFSIDAITPLITTYLASLPSRGTSKAAIGDVRLQFPPKVKRETVNKGQEPKSLTVMTFFADTGLDEIRMHRARAAATALETRLRDRLREELGGTYSVGVAYSNTQPQPGYGTMTVEFGSAPENVEKLVNAVLAEVERLRMAGPSDEDIHKIKEQERRQLETSQRQNAYWLNSLQTVHQLGWDPRRIARRLERAESLTRAEVHEAFKQYFPLDRYTVVSLMPEAGAAR
jgi:zinc protease